jgi:hypothetical protein
MRLRQLLAISGVISLLVGLWFLFELHQTDRDARSRDGGSSTPVSSRPRGCPEALTSVDPPTRTPVIGESMLLALLFWNTGSKSCEVKVSLSAAGFEKDPPGPQTYTVPPGKSLQHWSISAKQPGKHQIVVSSGGEEKKVGMNVSSNQFFSPSTMLVISALLSSLGPMATIPWWLEWHRKRRREPVDS